MKGRKDVFDKSKRQCEIILSYALCADVKIKISLLNDIKIIIDDYYFIVNKEMDDVTYVHCDGSYKVLNEKIKVILHCIKTNKEQFKRMINYKKLV